jgi:hypothetical protein
MEYVNQTENTSYDAGSSIAVFRAPLHSNGSYPIVASIFVAAGMCLPSRCQEIGLHVIIYKHEAYQSVVNLCYFCRELLVNTDRTA